jgi:hypothetical protein
MPGQPTNHPNLINSFGTSKSTNVPAVPIIMAIVDPRWDVYLAGGDP